MKQCKCCWCINYKYLDRDDEGRCNKCQVFCAKDKLEHCQKVVEINRNVGELCVVNYFETFNTEKQDFHYDSEDTASYCSGCFSCYWSGFPCNSCLNELFDRNMSLSDIVRTSMTYDIFKKEKKIWKPHWDEPDDYEEYREKFVYSGLLE